ncbi:MAG: hypothetical protein ACPL7J_11030, partial [Desulfomonilaceae bacterium]
LKDWGAWKNANIKIESLPPNALQKLKDKFVEWGCNDRKAKNDKKEAWKKITELLKERRSH